MKASMPTEKIRLKDEVYEITLMKGRDAFELTRKLGIKLSGVFSTMASAYVLGNPESLSSNLQGNIQDILGDDLLDLFDDVISPYTLKCNNDLIDDIREYETNHLGMTFPEDEVLFGGEYNG